MKRILLSLSIALLSFSIVAAQKIVLIDVTKILESMEEYQLAQSQVDDYAATWQQEISQQMDEVKSLYNKYQAEQVLLSDDQRKAREDEIISKEDAVRQLQKRRFGPDGDLFTKRQELVSPIQDKVYSAMEAYASEKSIDIIFDKGGSAGLLFANPEFDKTEDLKKNMGIK
ncbi:MAG TPA: OmpH family outer membrane protein [Saprospiraceae bacterium]|nr:OmpH family outer membrane protein [Saprospiraceae bacterium]HRX27987.1 OmpH family outer membrane protein [Saprospiraceae bacterium]